MINKLPIYISSIIAGKLGKGKYLFFFSLLEKKTNVISITIINKIKLDKLHSYPHFIYNIIINNNIDYKFIKYKKKFISTTDYIDNIKLSNVNSTISLGIDYYNRQFIVFKLKYLAKNNQTILYNRKYEHLENQTKFATTILFERRPLTDLWVFVEPYYNYRFYNNCIANKDSLDNLNIILNGGNVEYNDFIVSL